MPKKAFEIKQRRCDQKVRTITRGERIITSSVKNVPLTLEQRLAAYDPQRHGGEQMTTTQTLGAER